MTEVNAPIAAVTVFTALARITRRAKLTLEAGEHTLVVSQLPNTLQEESVRASGRGAGLKILGVEAKTQFTTETANIAELTAQLEALHDADRQLLAEDEVLKSRLEFLKTLREQGAVNFAKTLAYNEAKLTDATEFASYFVEQTSVIQAERRSIEQKRHTLAKEIEAQKQRILQAGGVKTDYREIHVTVSAAQQVEAELDVEYAVVGASWKPLYDVRLADNTVILTYLAEIRQGTGEDWEAVPLSLSTAKPAISATLPKLHAWYIAPPPPPVYYPQPAARAKSTGFGGFLQAAGIPDAAPLDAQMDMETAFEEDVDALVLARQAPVTPAAAPAQATIDTSGGASVTYRVESPVAVRSDGTPHKTTVTVLNLSVKLDYVCVPKLAEEAYLRATITNTSEFMLLPGTASLYHGADFVGKTQLNLVAPNEEFEAQLGVDNRVRVKRELVKRDVGKNMLGNTRRTTFSYKITLTNLVPTSSKITVFDQLPVSKHENIKVKLQDAAPEASEQNDLNILQWMLDIPTNQKREIMFAFNVEHPREMQVMGLG
jgi:uncharacterized protein (TIGR02231 family)